MGRTHWMPLNAVAMLAISQITPAHAASDPGVVRYSVKKGDTLYTLARDYCVHPSDSLALQKLNHVLNPRRMPVGLTLLVPRSMLRVETATARVIAFRGNVRIMHGAQTANAAPGGQVREGDTIVTNVNSFITLGLADGTSVSLPSQSRLRLARLRRVLLTNTIDRNFNILAGQVDSSVHPLSKPGDSFRFTTPSSVSTVRGTQLRVSYDPVTRQARTEVLEGKVEVTSPESSAVRMLPTGFGTLSQAGTLSDVRALLPAPVLAGPAETQDDPALHFALTPLAGAASYRTEIAADAGFLEVVADIQSGSSVSLPAIDDGTWFVRVSAIDSDGLQGFGKIYSFRRRLNATDLVSAERRDDTREGYLFRWRTSGGGRFQYRFQLFAKADLEHPIVDEPGLTGQDFTLTSLSAGDYQWRVDTLQFVDGQVYEKWSATQEFTVSKR